MSILRFTIPPCDTCQNTSLTYIRVDIMGDSESTQEIFAAKETRCRSWAFEATFACSLHPALVTDCNADATAHIRTMFRMVVVNGMNFFSFAMPANRSNLGSQGAVHVTGVLSGRSATRLRTVRSIFPSDIPVIWTPIRCGHGNCFTTSQSCREHLAKCARGDFFRVDVRNVREGSIIALPV